MHLDDLRLSSKQGTYDDLVKKFTGDKFRQTIKATPPHELSVLLSKAHKNNLTTFHLLCISLDTTNLEEILSKIHTQNLIDLLKNQDKFGRTPLHLAALYMLPEKFSSLVYRAFGPELFEIFRLQDQDQQTILHALLEPEEDFELIVGKRDLIKEKLSRFKMINNLIQNGKSNDLFKIQDKNGNTLLHLLLTRKCNEEISSFLALITDKLLDMDDSLVVNLAEIRNKKKQTIYHHAARAPYLLRLLIEKYRGESPETPFDFLLLDGENRTIFHYLSAYNGFDDNGWKLVETLKFEHLKQ